MPGQEQAFVSPHAPLPLPPVEEALLILAGTGVTGLALRDLPFVDNAGDTLRGNTMLQFARRVYASACGAHGTELFYTNDIYTTYGRFPAQLDAMHMCMWLQAHHLETDYYDRFMQPGAYHDAIANHMHVWHTG